MSFLAGRLAIVKNHHTVTKPLSQCCKYMHELRSPGCFLQGGAPAEDLKDLAEIGIDMDIDTFLDLNPNELQVCSCCAVCWWYSQQGSWN